MGSHRSVHAPNDRSGLARDLDRNTVLAENTYRILGSPSSIDNIGGTGAPLTSNTAVPSVTVADFSCVELAPTQVPPSGGVYWFGMHPTLAMSSVLTTGPSFVNGPARDLRLAASSPCVNTGNENFVPPEIENLLSLDGSGARLPLVAYDLLLQVREQQPASVNNWGIQAASPAGGNIPEAVIDVGCFERVENDVENDDAN